ncbi:bidirectional sugar transporter SWEET6b-like [Cucurbita moschata]|uniref:Bidirectional sugar transporter SWEET n=2 Tax=Cucurbita TaxID=3660 RepID=A0A6J1F709_CUCMO
MVSSAAAQETLCSLANLISFALVFPPLRAAYQIIKRRWVEELELCPYLANLLHYMLWLIYKIIQPHYILCIPVTLTGLLAQLLYLFIFYRFSDNPGLHILGICLVYVLIVMAATVALVLYETEDRALRIQAICNFYNILMNIKPITIVIKMIRTKSVKHVCLAVSLTSFLNACVWTAYAILKHDVYMHISNVVGVISGLLQLIVYAYYSLIASKLDEEKAEEELKNIPVDGADTVY